MRPTGVNALIVAVRMGATPRSDFGTSRLRSFTTRAALRNKALQLAEAKQHCAPYLAALGLLLNRAPLYAGPETVVHAFPVGQERTVSARKRP